jgi:hypothetical protein
MIGRLGDRERGRSEYQDTGVSGNDEARKPGDEETIKNDEEDKRKTVL